MKKTVCLLLILSFPIICFAQNSTLQQNTNSEDKIKILSLWKEKLFEQSGMSEQYFKKHFTITDVFLKRDEKTMSINLNYTFTYDWATVKDHTRAHVYMRSGQISDLQIKNALDIKFNHVVDQIISKDEVIRKVKECVNEIDIQGTKEFKADENFKLFDDKHVYFQGLRLEKYGIMVYKAGVYIKEESNRCKAIDIDLETGVILYCEPTKCHTE